MHTAAEVITENLIAGAIGLRERDWGFKADLLSMGMLYTLIQSPGLHSDRGVMGFVGMFVLFVVIAFVELSLAGGFWVAEGGDVILRESVMGRPDVKVLVFSSSFHMKNIMDVQECLKTQLERESHTGS